METERRRTSRFEISIPIQIEWDDAESGARFVEDGRTENVSPTGTLVHLPKHLPPVGSRVNLAVFEQKGAEVVRVPAQVLRIERNAARPLAALLVDATEKWRENVCNNQILIDSFTESVDLYED